jgi:hypothetical protein
VRHGMAHSWASAMFVSPRLSRSAMCLGNTCSHANARERAASESEQGQAGARRTVGGPDVIFGRPHPIRPGRPGQQTWPADDRGPTWSGLGVPPVPRLFPLTLRVCLHPPQRPALPACRGSPSPHTDPRPTLAPGPAACLTAPPRSPPTTRPAAAAVSRFAPPAACRGPWFARIAGAQPQLCFHTRVRAL